MSVVQLLQQYLRTTHSPKAPSARREAINSRQNSCTSGSDEFDVMAPAVASCGVPGGKEVAMTTTHPAPRLKTKHVRTSEKRGASRGAADQARVDVPNAGDDHGVSFRQTGVTQTANSWPQYSCFRAALCASAAARVAKLRS